MKLRLQITKDPQIRFISHLEYVRTIERAIRRAKLPAAYSEGFNPHLKFSLASALGVGVVSFAEFVEIELAENIDIKEAIAKMSAALPTGIRIRGGDLAPKKTPALMASASKADYRVKVPCIGDCQTVIEDYNKRESLLYLKAAPKSKAKVKEIDVKFFIPQITVQAIEGTEEIEIAFSCKITPNGSMKAVDLLNALNNTYDIQLKTEKADITRCALYKDNSEGFSVPMLEME